MFRGLCMGKIAVFTNIKDLAACAMLSFDIGKSGIL